MSNENTVIADRFELERVVGVGGMGSVYRGWDRADARVVAVKLVRATADRGRFEREAEVLEALDHPGIVRYVAHGEAPGTGAFIAMEWVEGETVAAHLERAVRMDPGEAATLCMHVARALGAAHDAGVVHRDLKPANVLLVEGAIERPKIVDFGIASGGGSGADRTEVGELVGTPGYMPPEQMRGGSGVGPTSDVYALGCILFRAIAGRPAFEGETTVEVLRRAAEQDAPRLSSVVDGVDLGLDDLVGRMLARDAAARPADGRATAEALAPFAVTTPSTMNEVKRGAPPRAGRGGRGVMLAAGAITAVIVVGFVGQRVATRQRDEAIASAAENEASSSSGAQRGDGACASVAAAFDACTPIAADFPTDLVRGLDPMAEWARSVEPTARFASVPWTRVHGGQVDVRERPGLVVVFRYRSVGGESRELHVSRYPGALVARRVAVGSAAPSGDGAAKVPACAAKNFGQRAAASGLDALAATEMRVEASSAGTVVEMRAGTKSVRFDAATCAVAPK